MKKRPINEASARWGNVVRGVLERADVRAAGIAERIFGEESDSKRSHIAQSRLHQNLSGIRRPSAERVRAIVRAVGELAGRQAAAYLEAEARASELLQPSNDDRVCDGLVAFELLGFDLSVALGFLRREGLERFRLLARSRGSFDFDFVAFAIVEVDKLTPQKRAALLDDLHRAHRKLLFAELDGRVPYRRALEEIDACFSRRGLRLDGMLDAIEAHRPESLRRDIALREAIGRGIATTFPDSTAAERFGAQHSIERAVMEYMDSHPTFTALGFQGGDFIVRILTAHRKGERLRLVSTAKRRRKDDVVKKYLRDHPEQPTAKRRGRKEKRK